MKFSEGLVTAHLVMLVSSTAMLVLLALPLGAYATRASPHPDTPQVDVAGYSIVVLLQAAVFGCLTSLVFSYGGRRPHHKLAVSSAAFLLLLLIMTLSGLTWNRRRCSLSTSTSSFSTV